MSFLRVLLTADRWLISRRGMLITIWVTLAILTHIPVPQSVQSFVAWDKLVHLIAYFPLGLLLPTCRIPGCHRGWSCLLVIAFYGILDELLQIPVGRTASVLDWLADVVGAAAGIAAIQLISGRQSNGT